MHSRPIAGTGNASLLAEDSAIALRVAIPETDKPEESEQSEPCPACVSGRISGGCPVRSRGGPIGVIASTAIRSGVRRINVSKLTARSRAVDADLMTGRAACALSVNVRPGGWRSHPVA